MNERDVQIESRKIFLFIVLFFCFLGVFMNSIAYPVGVIIGYIINYINFMITIQSSDWILKSGHNSMLVIVMFIAKTLLLIVGFAISILFKEYVNIAGVFFGYLIIHFTIHWLNYHTRKEEMK